MEHYGGARIINQHDSVGHNRIGARQRQLLLHLHLGHDRTVLPARRPAHRHGGIMKELDDLKAKAMPEVKK